MCVGACVCVCTHVSKFNNFWFGFFFNLEKSKQQKDTCNSLNTCLLIIFHWCTLKEAVQTKYFLFTVKMFCVACNSFVSIRPVRNHSIHFLLQFQK